MANTNMKRVMREAMATNDPMLDSSTSVMTRRDWR